MVPDDVALLKRIVSNPKVLSGKPTVRDTRIPVSLILNFVANGMTVEEICKEYPQLEDEDIRSALVFAEKVTEGEGVLDENVADFVKPLVL